MKNFEYYSNKIKSSEPFLQVRHQKLYNIDDKVVVTFGIDGEINRMFIGKMYNNSPSDTIEFVALNLDEDLSKLSYLVLHNDDGPCDFLNKTAHHFCINGTRISEYSLKKTIIKNKIKQKLKILDC